MPLLSMENSISYNIIDYIYPENLSQQSKLKFCRKYDIYTFKFKTKSKQNYEGLRVKSLWSQRNKHKNWHKHIGHGELAVHLNNSESGVLMHVEILVPNYSEMKAISCSICTKLRCPRSPCLTKSQLWNCTYLNQKDIQK